MFRTPSSLYRTFAFAEAVSWTLLITALIVRATTGLAWVVLVGGGIHGFVFLCYGATSILLAKNNRWRAWPITVALVSAVIPYATIPAEIWLHRTGRLAGAWRVDETGDPRESAWHDRLLRVFLRRPALLAGLMAVAVVVLFSALLVIGPPGGRS